MTIDDRNTSAQVAALHAQNKFLYAEGNSRSMEWYLRSDCILKVSLLAHCIFQTLSHSPGPSCCSFGTSRS